jgi:hypothetical protein
MTTVTRVFRKYPIEEFARWGQELYRSTVVPVLTAGDHGRFVAIDIDTGEYEIDDSEREASFRLRARLPMSQTWMERVGHRGAHKITGFRTRDVS